MIEQSLTNKSVAFLRVSSARQRDNTSHDTQETEMISYAKENNLDIVKIVRLVESAKNSKNRVHYQEALKWSLKNKVKHLLFYVFDRETRNLTDNENNELLIKSGILQIHYVREKKIYTKDSSDSDFFLRDIQAVTNKQYIRQLSTKIIDGCNTKAEQGWYPGNKPPIGYVNLKVKDEFGKEIKKNTIIGLDPNESNRNIVLREFELRSKGYSCEQIREIVLSEGLVHKNKVHLYHRSSIEYRLRNEFYYGFFVWGKKRYKGKHPIFIPKKHLDAVKNSFCLTTYQKKHEIVDDYGHFAGGYLTCSTDGCGCNIVYDKKTRIYKDGTKGVFHLYHCTNGKRIHPSLAGMFISEDNIWEQCGAIIDSISISNSIAEKISKSLNEDYKKNYKLHERQILNSKARILSLEKEEDSFYKDFKTGLIDEAMFRRHINFLKEEKSKLVEELEISSSAKKENFFRNTENTLELSKNAKSLWFSRSKTERLNFLKMILSNLSLNKVTIEYTLKKQFLDLMELKKKCDGGLNRTTFSHFSR